jgi:hypothetical protein
VGVGASGGFVSGPTGTAEAVLNLSSGQLSLIASGGMQAGLNLGGPSATAFFGVIFGDLKGNNNGYSGGFTSVTPSFGPGQFTISGSSGGISGGYAGMVPNGNVGAVTVGPSAGMIPGMPGFVGSATNFTPPLQVGTLPVGQMLAASGGAGAALAFVEAACHQ